ncbi:MAG: Firmicute plasmid replication protein (RepL) [Burkholderiales bacterium]|jgi:orotate phosphoribosyltransferase|nr:Firmicute plasmid replication protein (RepL) [Burkholderiales bacterium]
MLESPNNDRLIIDFHELVAIKKFDQSQKTFIRGINELLEKEIIYQSMTPSVYFLNMNLFFNGDRITRIQSYKLKKKESDVQPDLLAGLQDNSDE